MYVEQIIKFIKDNSGSNAQNKTISAQDSAPSIPKEPENQFPLAKYFIKEESQAQVAPAHFPSQDSKSLFPLKKIVTYEQVNVEGPSKKIIEFSDKFKEEEV